MRILVDSPSKTIDLALTLSCGQAFRWVQNGDWWVGMLGNILVKMRRRRGYLEVQSSHPISENFIVEYLRLDDDLSSIMSELSRDHAFRHIAEKVQGIRILRQDPWECIISYICSRNCRISMIQRILSNICRRFGDEVRLGSCAEYSFPGPEAVSKAEVSELAGCGLRYGKRQAEELKNVAELVLGGVLNFNVLKRMPYHEAKASLISLCRGVGNKVADCVLLFSLDKLEAFPIDVWVARAITELYHEYLDKNLAGRIAKNPHLSNRDYESLSRFARSRFGRYAGYAQEYLYYWRRTHKLESI
ncbi:MAG: DNA-3-methyladenine glycosylase family protein [Candidatus Bathyarchaeia archaeon]